MVSLLRDLGANCNDKSTKMAHALSLKNFHYDRLVYFKAVDKTGDYEAVTG